jgi:hypothetical protein
MQFGGDIKLILGLVNWKPNHDVGTEAGQEKYSCEVKSFKSYAFLRKIPAVEMRAENIFFFKDPRDRPET